MPLAGDAKLNELTRRIIGAAISVSRTLGHGFLEQVYRNALMQQLTTSGLPVVTEQSFQVAFHGKPVGRYIADLVVAEQVVVELKAVTALAQAHRAQLLNYLKASGLPVGLLLNFGTPRLEIRRVLNTRMATDKKGMDTDV